MITPTTDYRRTAHRVPERPFQGLDAAVNWCVGRYQRRASRLKELLHGAEQIDSLAADFSTLRDHDLQERLAGFREHFRREPQPREDMVLASLAAVREAAHRCVGLRAFPVQLAGALALHRGWLAEMATGEG